MTQPTPLIACPSPFHGGRFVLESLVGRGGMAEVYRAYDQGLGRWRAIKIMLPDYVRKRKLRARFQTEARAMALLDHKNIVRVYDVGEHQGAPFIVMELCPGGSLEAWLIDRGRFSPGLAIDCIQQICAGVQEAHDNGVIHRDIKSQNVLVGSDSRCKITDFGIAQTELTNFTNTGSTMGTLGFMAPEQRSDAKKVDHRSDVYSIGATLYNLLTGKVPTHLFAADRDDEILAGIEPDMLAVIKKATEYKREARYQTVQELSDALVPLSVQTTPSTGQLAQLRGDYTPPPVPRVRRLTPPGTGNRRQAPDSDPPHSSPASQSDYVISVPPQHVRHDALVSDDSGRSSLSELPPIGAHQPPPPRAGHSLRPETPPEHATNPPRSEFSGYVESPSMQPTPRTLDEEPSSSGPISRTRKNNDDDKGFAAELLETLAGPAMFLAIPLFLVLLAGVGYYSWNTSNQSAANAQYSSATGLFLSSVNRDERVFETLITLGADETRIRSQVSEYEAATDERARAEAASRLLGTARSELARLPTPEPSDLFAVREHRRVQMGLERLTERSREWTEAKRRRDKAEAGLFGG